MFGPSTSIQEEYNNSHVKSDYAHAIIQHHLGHILYRHLHFDISILFRPFYSFPNRNTQRHSSRW